MNQDVNFERLVNLTEGSSGADIKAIVTEAGMFAIRCERVSVNMSDFEKAIAKVMGKLDSDECYKEMYA
jgi:proteasome regulatory subunit